MDPDSIRGPAHLRSKAAALTMPNSSSGSSLPVEEFSMMNAAVWLHTVQPKHTAAQTRRAPRWTVIHCRASNKDGCPHKAGGRHTCPPTSMAYATNIQAGCSGHTSHIRSIETPAEEPAGKHAALHGRHSLSALQQSRSQQSGSTWLGSLEGEKRSSAWRERLYRMSKGRALTLLTVLFRALHAS